MPGLRGSMIAALFVEKNGPYFGLPNVDPWDKERDARKYAGPWPVVAHPPCERWGRYWSGGPNPQAKRQKLGDDGGCFEFALAAVRKYGGVLEHPAHSLAWEAFGLMEPPMDGGWVAADWLGGFTCHIEQGNYGHRARKATWLYAKSKDLPILKWGESSGMRLEEGFHSRAERARARCWDRADQANLSNRESPHTETVSRSVASNRRAKERGMTACEFLSRKQRAMTPDPFRDLLISIAESA